MAWKISVFLLLLLIDRKLLAIFDGEYLTYSEDVEEFDDSMSNDRMALLTGSDVTLGKYVVALFKRTQSKNGKIITKYFCTGVVIASDAILTAGRCLYDKNELLPSDSITVYIALVVRVRPTELMEGYDVERYVVHPEYVEEDISYNIAVVFLTKPIFENNNAGVIEYSHRLPHGHQCTVVAWTDKVANSSLSFISSDIGTIGECERYVACSPDSSCFCAIDTDPNPDLPDFCAREIGAAFICQRELIGIASNTQGSCRMLDRSGIYTSVPFFAVWIDEILDKYPNTGAALISDKTRPVLALLIALRLLL